MCRSAHTVLVGSYIYRAELQVRARASRGKRQEERDREGQRQGESINFIAHTGRVWEPCKRQSDTEFLSAVLCVLSGFLSSSAHVIVLVVVDVEALS